MYRSHWKLIVLSIDHFESSIVDERNCSTEQEAKDKYETINNKMKAKNVKGILIHI